MLNRRIASAEPDPMAEGQSVSLREFLEALIWQMQNTELAKWEAHQALHTQEGHARKLVEEDILRRLRELNDMRMELVEDRNQLVSNVEYKSDYRALNTRLDLLQKWKDNMDGRLWMLGWVIISVSGMVTTIINLLFRWMGR